MICGLFDGNESAKGINMIVYLVEKGICHKFDRSAVLAGICKSCEEIGELNVFFGYEKIFWGLFDFNFSYCFVVEI